MKNPFNQGIGPVHMPRPDEFATSPLPIVPRIKRFFKILMGRVDGKRFRPLPTDRAETTIEVIDISGPGLERRYWVPLDDETEAAINTIVARARNAGL